MALQYYRTVIGNETDVAGKNYAAAEPVYIRNENGTYADLYSDPSGTNQILQDGSRNITNSLGIFSCYVETGKYTQQSNGISMPIEVFGIDYMAESLADEVDFISSEVDRAETAADTAMTAGWIYTDAAAGEAARTDGDYFWVVSAESDEVLELWLMGATTASDTGKRTVSYYGVKQSVELSEYLSNNDFIELVVQEDITDNFFVNAETGVLVADANNVASDFIPVFGENFNAIYRGRLGNNLGGIAGYDENKVFVSSVIHPGNDGLSGATEAVISIQNPQIKYIRATLVTTLGDTLSIKSTKGNSAYGLAKESESLAIDTRDLLEKNTDLLSGLSLVDNTAIRATDGLAFSTADYESTPLVPVIEGQVVTFTGWIQSSVGIVAFDAGGNYYSTIYNPTTDSSPLGAAIQSLTFTIGDPNIAFIRASNRKANGITLTLNATLTYDADYIEQRLGEQVDDDVRVRFVDSERFEVDSITPDGSYATHVWQYFDRPIFSDQGWICTQVRHNGEYIVQGNYNTIHIMRDGVSDDDIFVGILHGCEKFLYVQFYLDGIEFDPTTATAALSGTEFKIQSLSEFYTPDRTASIAETGGTGSTVAATPLEVRAQRVAEMTIKGNNEIERHQKLLVKKDGVHFKALFGAMQQTMQSVINGVITLNDKDGTRNYFPVSTDDPQPLAPSTVRLSNGVSYGDKNCFATKITAEGGDSEYGYVVSTWAENSDSSQIKKNHIQAYLEQQLGNKLYLQPVITSQIVSAYPEFTLDGFNNGDVIDMKSRTTIRVFRK